MTLLASDTQYDNTTTPTVNSTGGALLVFGQSWHGSGVHAVPTDSKSNTWSGLTAHGAILAEGPRHSVRMSYSVATTVGTGHTITRDASGNGSVAALVFDATAATPFDVQSSGHNAGGSTSCPNGSVTPTTGSSLIVAMWAIDDPADTGAFSFLDGSGFTVATSKDVAPGANHGLVTAYKYVTALTSVSPTLTRTNANQQLGDQGVIAVFKMPSAGGKGLPFLVWFRQPQFRKPRRRYV